MRTPIRVLGFVAIFGLVLAACSPAADEGTEATTTTEAEATTTTTTTPPAPSTTEPMVPELSLDTSGWPALEGGFHYEGWAIVDGAPVTTGTFNIADGAIVGLDGNPIESFQVEGIEAASAIVITIEPAGDTDDIPSDTHFVAGDVADGAADLTIGHGAALGTDFSTASGTFLLATPTDDPEGNELSGIWFLELPGPTPSLELPALPDGWRYEGWAVIDGMPLTSGTFLTAEGADDSAPFSGPNEGPPFPGEDYVTNAPDGVTLPTDLSGQTIVISVEPYPDDSPAPFVLKPLLGTAAEDATDHASYPLDNSTEPLPSGTATISS